MKHFISRVIGFLKLDGNIYREVAEDKKALGQAIGVIFLSCLATAAGSTKAGIIGIIFGVGISLFGWCLWAFLNYLVGTRILSISETVADPGKYWRIIGFTAAPGYFRLLAGIPEIKWHVFGLTTLWMLAAMILGVKLAFNYQSTLRAVAVCITGWILQAVILGLFASLVMGS